MVETTLRRAIDGAHLVEFHEHRDVFVTWNGSKTFNVYSAEGDTLREIEPFSVADENEEPLPREEARSEAVQYLNREFA